MRLTARELMSAYRAGIFPMAEARDDPDIFWVDPERRGVFPIGGFRISRSLARTLRRDRFSVTFDTAFAAVVSACAEREETWISTEIEALYGDLHAAGVAHSVEVWDGTSLAGGVYGVSLGAAFFGESMFSRRTDASKVALAHLMDRLQRQGFRLFDTQFLTPHLASLGAVEIPRHIYRGKLAAALSAQAEFGTLPAASGQDVVQRSAQTS